MIFKRNISIHTLAFTLVELLIVVVILSILAMITIPNLMEAQVRTKVSVAKADLRTVGDAIVRYQMDHMQPPPARTYCAGMETEALNYNIIPPELTSPIPYLTTRPRDVFSRVSTYKYLAPGPGWSNETRTLLALWIPKIFPEPAATAEVTGVSGLEGRNPALDDEPWFDARKSPVSWGVWSVGPAGARPFYESEASHVPVPKRTWYDPTNGTVSRGVIARISDR